MASGLTPKIRLVRCPNCRKVLYETPGLTVYKCGGCDAVLIAKNQNVDGIESKSDLHGMNADSTNESDCKKSISSSNDTVLPSSGECSMDPNHGMMSPQEPLESIINQLSDVNISNHEDSNHENQNFESIDATLKQSEVVDEVCSSSESTPEILDEVHSSNESVLHEDIKLLSSMAVNSDVELDDETTVITRKEINSNTLNQSQRSVRHRFDRLMSTDTFRSSDFVSPSSELSDSIESTSKSPTMKSSHAYDGSVSSYDDHIPDQHIHSFVFVALEEKLKREKFFLNSDSDVQQQARNLFTEHSILRSRSQLVGNHRRNENQFRVPSRPTGCFNGGAYERGGSSNQMWDDDVSTHRTLERPDEVTSKTSGKPINAGGNRKGKHIPAYYDQKRPEQTRHGLDYSRSQDNSSRVGYWPEQMKSSQRLPLPVRNNGFSRIHSADTYYNSYSSSGFSQQRYMESEFPLWRTDSESDDQRRRGRDHHGVRRHVPKKHIRPIAGGAPFVTCYRCFQPIQFPADFLILKRKCHLLKCGGCSKVLKFSLRNKIHLVRYAPAVVDPQSSPVDDASNSVIDGQSFFGSFSNKHRGRKDVVCRSSYDSSDTMEESAGEAPTRHSSNLSRDKHDKFSPENAVKGSQLHQLMGYSSARELLRRSASELVDTGTSLYYADENQK